MAGKISAAKALENRITAERGRWPIDLIERAERTVLTLPMIEIDAEVAKLPEVCRGLWGPGNYARAVRVLDGPADRLDRVGSIGNAVLPQIPEALGRAIMRAATR